MNTITSNIYGASILLENGIIYFYDRMLVEIDTPYNGTWITAYRLRWRFNQDNENEI